MSKFLHLTAKLAECDIHTFSETRLYAEIQASDLLMQNFKHPVGKDKVRDQDGVVMIYVNGYMHH